MDETLTKEEAQAPEGVDLANGRGSPAPDETADGDAPRTDEQQSQNDSPAADGTEQPEGSSTAEAQNAEEKGPDEKPQLSPLEAAQKESAEYKEAWQRERADFANYRKRMIHEKAQLREGAIGSVIHDLLEPLDNLDRVLAAKSENEEVGDFIEGVEMIRNQFLGVLEKYNVRAVSPKNEPFDPFHMEAIASEEREDLENEQVLEVYQVGYVQELSDGPHVLRPARVKVGRPAAKKAAKEEAADEQNSEQK